MKLNKEQEIAVKSTKQFIFLLAGAGSGKTRVIVERIKHLLKNEVLSNEILCITFTNKAAQEMKSRLKDYEVQINTFHSYAYRLIKEQRNFKIFEFNNEFNEDEILMVTNYKNSLKNLKKPKVYDRYQKYLKERSLLDFDDLLMDSIPHIKNHNFKYIFVDEFQDTNPLQFLMLENMIKDKVNVFAVGDPDQSIYQFRGAKASLINKYINKYNAELLKLEVNYRSNQSILDAANNLIKNNVNRFKKTLKGYNKSNKTPSIYLGSKKQIDKHIIKTIKNNKHFTITILYRNEYQVSYLKQLLNHNYLFNVNLITFHEAKGLEFLNVIIYGAEILPFDKENIYSNTEEERRLLFVGITRAIDRLYIYSTLETKFLKELKIPFYDIEDYDD